MSEHNLPPKDQRAEPDPRIPAYLRDFLNELATTIHVEAQSTDEERSNETEDLILLNRAELNELIALAKKETLAEIMGIIILHNDLDSS